MMPTNAKPHSIHNVGDKVWLSLENIRTVCPTKKLDYKWLSPYVVKRVISHSAYRLNLIIVLGKFGLVR